MLTVACCCGLLLLYHVIHTTAGIDGKIGKIAVAKDARYAVFDMSKDVAAALIAFSQTQDLKAIEFGVCHTLPEMSPQVR
jgi:hypothetical protein